MSKELVDFLHVQYTELSLIAQQKKTEEEKKICKQCLHHKQGSVILNY